MFLPIFVFYLSTMTMLTGRGMQKSRVFYFDAGPREEHRWVQNKRRQEGAGGGRSWYSATLAKKGTKTHLSWRGESNSTKESLLLTNSFKFCSHYKGNGTQKTLRGQKARRSKLKPLLQSNAVSRERKQAWQRDWGKVPPSIVTCKKSCVY